MNLLPYWKENIIREKHKLDWKQCIDGKWIQFYKETDSIPAKIFELKNSKYDGQVLIFYKNGQVESYKNYRNENLFGLNIGYYENGKIRDSVIYRLDTAQNGYIFSNKIFMKTFYENGNNKKIESYDSLGVKNGKWVDYYENGQIRTKLQYSSKNINLSNAANRNSYGNKIEKYTYYYPNGQIRFTLDYSNDKIVDGKFVEYHQNGQEKSVGYLKNGLRDLEWIEFYENSKIASRGNYSSGSYTFCGVVPYTEYYEYKIGTWEYFYSNGELKAKGEYRLSFKNIETNCEGGEYVNCGVIADDWTIYDALGKNISSEKALQSKIIENQEVLRKRIYEIE
jgi:antitoxin component YwqK of YwqJK toxin-antitoxin module